MAPIVQQFIHSMRIRSEIKEILDLILRNLLSNAIKFADAGGSIHIGATNDGDQVSYCPESLFI
ncbi:hypothetical protein ACP8HI_24715 [Paenibacillus sp. FA6]|uniref:hypothetical protein n=1 Tax=Paenibacillus sp. FA6 TaxID=3413029 RepID=UPI003F65DD26